MSLSRLVLWSMASEWQTLSRFAGRLASLPSGMNAAKEAARYLCYHHGLSASEWAQVDTFARENRADLEGADVDARTGRFAEPGYDDDTGYDASTIGQQLRLLFGFAAQHTLFAEDVARQFLTERHNLGAAEWEQIEQFLAGQEHYHGGGELMPPSTP